MTVGWRDMDRATRSAAYDNSRAVANSAAQLARWKALSAPIRASSPGERDVVYGPRPRNRFDLFACGEAAAPLLVFIHGGYWQRNAKEDFACMAIGPLARGFDVAMVGYTLTPDATLIEIVAEIDAALSTIARLATGRVIVSGWSAGGHLAALMLGRSEVSGVLAISGIYDLEPLCGTLIDDQVHISETEVTKLSPIRRDDPGRLAIAYGVNELPELCRQSLAYRDMRVANTSPTWLLPSQGADHFSVLDGLIDPGGDLTRTATDLLHAD